MPGTRAATKGRKSLSIGSRRETSYIRDEVYGRGAAATSSRTRRPLPGLVSYMRTGDDEPGLSKFSTTPTP